MVNGFCSNSGVVTSEFCFAICMEIKGIVRSDV